MLVGDSTGNIILADDVIASSPSGQHWGAVQPLGEPMLAGWPGGYSLEVSGGTGATAGVALTEVYDNDPADSATRLVNVSCLGFVAGETDVLVAGIVLRGNANKQLLIRAVGPGLAPPGVTGALANPRLFVARAGQLGGETNDDWPGTAQLKSAFANAGAFTLPENSRDAALLLSLEPGAYSVVVTGADNQNGTALVEIYDLDP